jgi:hypothetical protein
VWAAAAQQKPSRNEEAEVKAEEEALAKASAALPQRTEDGIDAGGKLFSPFSLVPHRVLPL